MSQPVAREDGALQIGFRKGALLREAVEKLRSLPAAYTSTGQRDDVYWPRGVIYQDGVVNDLFRAYQYGYALGRATYMGSEPNEQR